MAYTKMRMPKSKGGTKKMGPVKSMMKDAVCTTKGGR